MVAQVKPNRIPIASTGTGNGGNELPSGVFQCYVDGSWREGGSAGYGVTIVREGKIIKWVSNFIQAMSLAKAEARAIPEGYKLLGIWANGEGVVFSDSKETVQALGSGRPEITNWRSYEEVWEAWIMQARSQGKLKAVYCSREEQEMKLPHILANKGRLFGWEKHGSDEPNFTS